MCTCNITKMSRAQSFMSSETRDNGCLWCTFLSPAFMPCTASLMLPSERSHTTHTECSMACLRLGDKGRPWQTASEPNSSQSWPLSRTSGKCQITRISVSAAIPRISSGPSTSTMGPLKHLRWKDSKARHGDDDEEEDEYDNIWDPNSGRSTEDLGRLLWGRSVSFSSSSFSHFLVRLPTSWASSSNFFVEDLCSFCTSVNIRKMELSIEADWAGKLSSGPTITTMSVWVVKLLWLLRC